ncbi:hypothetical protein GUJ93_ZPchr0005g14895 [Zizania palustris]|uniref:Uncharacterized protein n=1 Tax=Zizania palustris TaxID=103762 RepID=A0A8J5SUD1_ZIZPA|nr:hypothetical protein GUJ93_ZPchr0005g14895 [Zizania palustris]
MELTGVALRRSLTSASPVVLTGRGRRRRNPERVSCVGRRGEGFADERHLAYYEETSRKAVARNLTNLRAMGIVAGDAAKEKVLSEAAELLLMQELNRMRDEEGELKKKMKDTKAAMKTLKKQQKEAKKAAVAMNCDDWSSSESSESECDDQIVELELSCIATATVSQTEEGIEISTEVPQIAASSIAAAPAMEYDKAAMKAMNKREKEQKKAAKMVMKMKTKKKKEKKMATQTCCKDEDSSSCSSESSDSECEDDIRMSRCATMITPQTQSSSAVFPIILPQIPEPVALEQRQAAQISSEPANATKCTTGSIAAAGKPMMSNRIEVCMGGKCKKSGSLAILQELEKKVGADGAVVGCKCLGKCGLGPNVRLRSQGSTCTQQNPLCIGVGLEDVDTIVSGLFGDDDMGTMN